MKFSLPVVAAIGVTLAATIVLYSVRANSGTKEEAAPSEKGAVSANLDSRWEQARAALKKAGLETQLNSFDQAQDPSIVMALDSLDFIDISADALEKAAVSASSDSLMTEAADRWYYLATSAPDSLQAMQYASSASVLYKKAMEMDSLNNEAPTGLARCLVFFYGQPMQGVQLLKKVETRSPEFTPAIAILADMSVTSGQLDKAVDRYQRLVQLDPRNPTYHIRLAEIFENMGEKQKAILSLQTAKKLISDKSIQQQLDKYINELKR